MSKASVSVSTAGHDSRVVDSKGGLDSHPFASSARKCVLDEVVPVLPTPAGKQNPSLIGLPGMLGRPLPDLPSYSSPEVVVPLSSEVPLRSGRKDRKRNKKPATAVTVSHPTQNHADDATKSRKLMKYSG